MNLLATIRVLQKYSKFDRMFGCIVLLFCYSSNGRLQLELQINSLPLKNEMTASACFKERQSPGKYLVTAKGPLMTVPVKYNTQALL